MSAEKKLRDLIMQFKTLGIHWMSTDDLDKMLSLLDDALFEARETGKIQGHIEESGDDW